MTDLSLMTYSNLVRKIVRNSQKKHRDDRSFFFLAIFYDSCQSSPSRESVRGCVIYFSRDYEIFYTDKEFARKNYGIIGAMIAVSQPRSP